jgi:chlorite dismutase
VWESAWATISIHRTKEGAESAMNKHKADAKKKHDDFRNSITDEEKEFYTDYPFDTHKDWYVKEIELQD